MRNLEEQKTHYDELPAYIERMLKTYNKYKDHPEDSCEFGVIEKEGLGSDKERTYYTQLKNDIEQLYFKAKN